MARGRWSARRGRDVHRHVRPRTADRAPRQTVRPHGGASVMKATEQPTAVVLGLGQNGMATCRALGRVGIPVIGIDTDLDQPSARTRYATKFHCPDFLRGGAGLVESLEQIGRRLPTKGVLFPS